MRLSRDNLIRALPIHSGPFAIRPWRREDIDAIAHWPSYPPEYAAFNTRFARMTAQERGWLFEKRSEEPGRITMVAEAGGEVIGYFALIDIDWDAGVVENMGIRLHPSWCGRGAGTRVLRAICRWCFDCGIEAVRLDVAEPNARAVRCYQKVGFAQVGEVWRDDPGHDPPTIRFFLMECRPPLPEDSAE